MMTETLTHETPESVSAWAVAKFGPDGSDLRCAVRANLEMAELLAAVTLPEPVERIAEEAADVCIPLWRLAVRTGTDPRKLRHFNALPVDVESAALYANRSLGRLLAAIPVETPGLIELELLTTLCYVRRLAEFAGFDLQQAIDAKMDINRARKWRVDPTGQGFHVKDEVTP